MIEPTRIVQLQHGPVRRVARVEEPVLRMLSGSDSVYGLVNTALSQGVGLADLIAQYATRETVSYDDVYSGSSAWQLLVPIDHPEPARCLVSGTGLTHLGSAAGRDMMHGKADGELTDSMRMFRAGVDGGRPRAGRCGTPPEWFYKGTGTILRASGEHLLVPGFAEDGGEEAEIAGVYVIDAEGRPRRVGMAVGNEFSDHVFEKRNYLNLAGSKLRTCALGPELVIGADFQSVPGEAIIERDERQIWRKVIATGEAEMCHSLLNIEHHHFKFDAHRRAGDVHVHYFGAHSLSFSDDVRLQAGDVMTIRFDGFGRALRNPVAIAAATQEPILVQVLA
jgi:hypothetical protein